MKRTVTIRAENAKIGDVYISESGTKDQRRIERLKIQSIERIDWEWCIEYKLHFLDKWLQSVTCKSHHKIKVEREYLSHRF